MLPVFHSMTLLRHVQKCISTQTSFFNLSISFSFCSNSSSETFSLIVDSARLVRFVWLVVDATRASGELSGRLDEVVEEGTTDRRLVGLAAAVVLLGVAGLVKGVLLGRTTLLTEGDVGTVDGLLGDGLEGVVVVRSVLIAAGGAFLAVGLGSVDLLARVFG